MLAVGLMLALAGSVYAFYFFALDARAALRQESETLFAQRRILDLMAEDLRSAADVALAFGFSGSAEEFSLMRARVPSPAVFYDPAMTRARPEDDLAGGAFELQADVELVRYYLEPPNEDDEEPLPGPLTRTRLKALRPGGIREDTDLEVVALSEHVKFLYLQYRVGEEWQESWSQRGIPKAVRITLGTLPLPEGMEPNEYPYDTLWREVAIPAGGGAGQSGGRGGGGAAGGGAAGGGGGRGAGR